MKIVINVPDYVKEQADDGKGEELGIPLWLAYEIANGTPLPKGHGRLIDADNIIPLALKEKTLVLKDTDLIDVRSREFIIDYLFKDIEDYINNMPTIIEADKGESEDKE